MVTTCSTQSLQWAGGSLTGCSHCCLLTLRVGDCVIRLHEGLIVWDLSNLISWRHFPTEELLQLLYVLNPSDLEQRI